MGPRRYRRGWALVRVVVLALARSFNGAATLSSRMAKTGAARSLCGTPASMGPRRYRRGWTQGGQNPPGEF